MEQPGRFSLKGLFAPLASRRNTEVIDALATLRARDRAKQEAVRVTRREELREALAKS